MKPLQAKFSAIITNCALSEKLWNAGIRRKTVFFSFNNGWPTPEIYLFVNEFDDYSFGPRKKGHKYPVFTAHELIEMLPQTVDGYSLNIAYSREQWDVYYTKPGTELGMTQWLVHDTADDILTPLSNVITWLIKSNHLSTEQLNK